MKVRAMVPMLLWALLAGLFAWPGAPVHGQPDPPPVKDNKPPVYRGGRWVDHFWTEQLTNAAGVEARASHLQLKLAESLHWRQTWTAHFAGGEFWHTEAISDSVRLASAGAGQFFTTGVYTSTVLNAGKTVDWSAAEWNYSGRPERLGIGFRIGNTPTPDDGWTGWTSPRKVFGEYWCGYIIPTGDSVCSTNMLGIESSQYLQYRARFRSPNPARTVALYDIDLLYGTRALSGIASSVLVTPSDLGEWQQVIISSTIPLSTTLAVDVLAADGTVLLGNVGDGDSLAGIDPLAHPGLKLRVTLATQDRSRTPDLDRWGLRWSVRTRQYLPVILH